VCCCSVLQRLVELGSVLAICFSVLQCGVVSLHCCCIMSQYGAKFSKLLKCVLQQVPVCCNISHCVAVCCSVLRCVAVCCSVLQCVAVCCSVLQRVTVCCSVLQCVALCCSVLQCVAVCCSML